jgi:Asp-tRNAAsn/Glu-tRNAGln amidotransferase A subunit and related amidases
VTTDADFAAGIDLETAGVAELQEAMASGRTTSEVLVRGYLDRIERYDRQGPAVHAVRRVARDAIDQAKDRDGARSRGDVRGPMHGIPVLVKDNIDVAGLPTTAGSLALEHSTPDRDAALVTRLREAGAVILGKANLTEFANFMADDMPSGYSSLGGQVLNPYDASLTPCGSSSGSGAAAALGLATVAVGSETDGSILCPCDAQSLVGVKPTLGLVSSEGILPIASSQDCAGPMARTVYDAAALLGALAGEDFVSSLDLGALQGACLVVPAVPADLHADDRELFDAALQVMRDRGARLVDVQELPATDEFDVLHYEFARDLAGYLARLPDGAPMRSLADIVAWNEAHADVALKYGQARLLAAVAVDHDGTSRAYEAMRARDLAVASEHGVDSVLAAHDAQAVVVPSWRAAGIGARAGYPSVIVPAGYRRSSRRPFGLTFLGTARTEARLLSLAYDYEQASRLRRPVSEINPSLLRDA